MRTFKNASIKEYLNEISKHPLLTPDEEIELSRIIHEAAALEEPYTPEDCELLRGIAVQMGVALDLSRLRKQVDATIVRPSSGAALSGADASFTPTVVVEIGRAHV